MRNAFFLSSSHHAALLIVLVLANISSAVDVVHLSNGHLDLEYDDAAGRINLRTLVAGYLENRDAEGHVLANCIGR